MRFGLGLVWQGHPADAPELNPIESVWGDLKSTELANQHHPRDQRGPPRLQLATG
jgi:hypothetical protein